MVHNENIQTLEVISKYLKVEEERLKAYNPSNVAFVAKGNGPKGNGPCRRKTPKKVIIFLKTLTLKVVLRISKRLREMEGRRWHV